METHVLALALLALVMAGVTLHAWRLGNERRDVGLLGAIAVLLGSSAAAGAVL